MSTRLLDYNPLTGERELFKVNNDGTFSIVYEQPVDNILEMNKRDAIERDAKKQIDRDWVLYARIPNIVAIQWRTNHGVDIFDRNHKKKMFELLNSPDYRYLKAVDMHHAVK